MALVQQLPNGHLVLLLTPREATMLSDQILEPQDYPWQASESQVVAFEVKQRLKGALEMHLHGEVAVISQQVSEVMQVAAREAANEAQAERRRMRELAMEQGIAPPEDPPDVPDDEEPDEDEPDDEDEDE